ncbi:MAG TPA: PIN domain-containing protein [Candidatus Norongarragalinales archaeon]|nr:PIN domain-containing protein [Candidatus Norongarragalinales archaeon]
MYFFDTYAIVEICKGNPNYIQFREAEAKCSIFNMAETYYVLKTQYDQKLAENSLSVTENYLTELSSEVIQKAMDFRAGFNAKNRKSALSYADAIGYTYALENDLEFVTGDDAFKNLKGVRFLK